MHCHHDHSHIHAGLHHHHHHEGLAEDMSRSQVLQLRMVFILSLAYLLLQVVGGVYSGSLALLAEAGHKLGDAGVIGLALTAAWFATRPSSLRHTFGMERVEVLAALLNGVLLCGVAVGILLEAWERLSGGEGHHHVHGESMLWVSLIGLAINLTSVALLRKSKESNLNIKVTYLHLITDTMASLSTIVSSLLIVMFHWEWADIALSLFIVAMVLNNAIRIIGAAGHVFLEAAPDHLGVDKVAEFLQVQPGVHSVHDLHIWTISTGKEALLAHVVVAPPEFTSETVRRLEHQLRHQFSDLCHITLQLEPEGFEEAAIPF